MPEHQRTFPQLHESIEDALGTAIQALGGHNKVAAVLWPNKRLATAYAHLKSCLRDDKAEKLDPHELLVIGKMAQAVGEHAIVEHINDYCGYEVPKVRAPEDERARLQHEFTESVRVQRQILNRLEQLSLCQ